MKPGKFITFEGIDGAGKSTHLPFVTALVQSRGLTVVCTREPGGTALGETLRELLLHRTMHIETEALLMFAARREHLAQVIQPALSRGDWVISDRFTDASYAYQGGGRKLGLDKLAVLEQWVHPALQPDLTLLFDVPLAIARQRLNNNGGLDKFEQEKSEFFQNTRSEYLRRAAEFPDRFRVIDASLTIDIIEKELHKVLLTI